MDQGVIKVQPLLKNPFFKDVPDISINANIGKVGRDIDRDLSKIPMFWCDDLERKGDPVDAQRLGSKDHVPELCCFREVE